MDFDRIFASRPVNITAYRVTGQAGCAKDDAPITESEIKEAIARLVRKQRLLKVVLKIKTQSQHTNTLNKFKKRIPNFRAKKDPRSLIEYVRIGREIQRLNTELCANRAARRFVAEQLAAHKAERASGEKQG